MSKLPVTVVILGGTGDLAEHKLIPALYDLHVAGCLPETFYIVGFSRKPLRHEEYQAFIAGALQQKGITPDPSFVERGRYKQGDLTDEASYHELADYLRSLDAESHTCTSKLFYLAVPPVLYEPVCTNVAAVGLTVPCVEDLEQGAWSRLLIEKPFGDDRVHAAHLDSLLGTLFAEEQVFRIDHYLAKETLQNVLTFRFGNYMFNTLWNSKHIVSVDVELHESFGIKKRAGFYDGIGALRDVGQNHILQMLALIAMEEPASFDAQAIRAARAEVLRNVVLDGPISNTVVRGQYVGYRDTEGVPAHSETETFFALTLRVNTKRWEGTKFTVRSGKALHETAARITVTFKETVSAWTGDQSASNVLTFTVQPNEGVHLQTWFKKPGFTDGVRIEDLSFLYPIQQERLPDAYERVLFDALRGDQTLFPSTAEVEAQWNLITPILEQWHTVPLQLYVPGVHPSAIEGTM